MTKQLKADILLLTITIIWGASFILMKQSTGYIPPFTFLTYRYLLASIVLCIIFPKPMFKINMQTIKYGFIIGLVMFAGCAFQIIGLQYTSASKSGFISGLCVVLVPLILAVRYKKLPSLALTLGVAVSFTGLGLLTIDSTFTVNTGDLLTLLCAVFFAFQVIFVSKFSPGVEPIGLTEIALLSISVLSFIPGLIFENLNAVFNFQSVTGLIFTAIFCSSFAYTIQIAVQKHTTPVHAALIFMAEPVFGMIFAYVLGGEALTARGIIGCVLVFSGMLLSEFKTVQRK